MNEDNLQNNSKNEVKVPDSIKNLIKMHVESKKNTEEIIINKEKLEFDPNIKNIKCTHFEKMKKWDGERGNFLNSHRRFIEKILLKIDDKIINSTISTTKIINFFNERKKQEIEYEKFITTKLPKLSEISSEIKLYSIIDNYHLSKLQKINDFHKFIEKSLIEEIILVNKSEFEKTISAIKEKIKLIISKLNEINLKTTEECRNYKEYFTKEKKINERDDFFSLNYNLLKFSEIQNKTQQSLATEVLSFWESALLLEYDRLKMLKDVFTKYTKKEEEYLGKNSEISKLYANIDQFDPSNDSQQIFMIAKIFNNEELEFLKKFSNKYEITFKEIKLYFENFEFDPPIYNELIKKEFFAFVDIGVITKNFKECWILLTIDNFIVIFDDNKEKPNKNIRNKIKIENIKIEIHNENEKSIKFIEKINGFIFDKYVKIELKFDQKDELKEFISIIK